MMSILRKSLKKLSDFSLANGDVIKMHYISPSLKWVIISRIINLKGGLDNKLQPCKVRI